MLETNGIRPNLVRMLLIISLVFYLPWTWFFPVTGKGAAAGSKPAEVENGMGGGTIS